MKGLKGLRVVCGLVLAATFISGCLVGDKSVSAVYDAGADQFRFLIVFQHIGSIPNDGNNNKQPQPKTAAEDLQWLQALYANRNHLILTPQGNPFGWGILDGETAYLRLSNSRYAGVELGASRALEAAQTAIPLNDIQILPGKFFMPAEGNLAFFQQIVVPGKAADAVVDFLNQQLKIVSKDSIIGAIDAELDRRRLGGERMAWDEFTREAIDQTKASVEDTTSQKEPALSAPLDSRSLHLLRDALAGGDLLQRSADKIHISANMTEADVAGFIAFASKYREAYADMLHQAETSHAPTPGLSGDEAFQKMLDSATVAAGDKKHVEVTIDLMTLFGAITSPLEPSLPHGDASLTNLADFAGKGLDVDRDLTMKKVVDEFVAGTLPAYPPEKSVEPGTGLGEIHAATQP